MLKEYFVAEQLKFRRTIYKKLIFIIPITLIFLSSILLFAGVGLGGFQSSLVNNWCILVAPFTIIIMCNMVNNKEQQQSYHTIYSLDISARKVFVAKFLLIAKDLLIISFILPFVALIPNLLSLTFSSALKLGFFSLIGYLFIYVSLLWRVPLYLYLDIKLGFIKCLIIDAIFNIIGGLFLSLTKLFWVIPYSWTSRVMMTFFSVLPNGLIVPENSRLYLNKGSCFLLFCVSLCLCYVILRMFSKKYENRRDSNRD